MSATHPVVFAPDELTEDVTHLLQGMIRNACVNDGSPESGQEIRNVNLLADYLSGVGLEFERFEPSPGRVSLLARLPGADVAAPTLMLLGHTDVVPADPRDWERDPFGGELIDGFVWGRGAIDMLSTTAAMAVATRNAARQNVRPRGTLLFLAAADEESLGRLGSRWIVEHASDRVRADYVLGELGGWPVPLDSGARGPILPVMVAEKGAHWARIKVKGRASHGSMPFGADNAVVNVAEVVRRLAANAPRATLVPAWSRMLRDANLESEVSALLSYGEGIEQYLAETKEPALAGMLHAMTRTTITPTVVHAGVKTNIVPDRADLSLDIRTLPGQTSDDVDALLLESIGDLVSRVEIEHLVSDPSTQSPVDTPLFASIRRVTNGLIPTGRVVPMLDCGTTDARFFRPTGAVVYGTGLFSDRLSFHDMTRMGHGPNERVDVDSLRLAAEFWAGVVLDVLTQTPAG